jgi:8-oxo-dGTP pyrophosphatase MutT (NUDIX family)
MLQTLRDALEQHPDHRAPPGDRLAAVLAPLILEDEPALLFTRRREDLTRHAGEVSFPGGLPHDEDGDDLRRTALRETEEEVGIPPEMVEILGALPPVHTTVSGILVVPFVGALRERTDLRMNAAEISEIFEVPVARLEAVEATVELERGGHRFLTHVYDVSDNVIWGATGRMVHDFLDILRGGRA